MDFYERTAGMEMPAADGMGYAKRAEAELMPEEEEGVGEEALRKWKEAFKRYQEYKQELDDRIKREEKFLQLRQWECYDEGVSYDGLTEAEIKHEKSRIRPTTAYLFNSIANKTADLMDNSPETVVLPREQSDDKAAKDLCSVLPVVYKQNRQIPNFRDRAWYFTAHGMMAAGVFWDKEAKNGLGEIRVRNIDLLRLFWEPLCTDIQESKYVFLTSMEDTDTLREQYPELADRIGEGSRFERVEYEHNANVDTSEKSMVVDVYYKRYAIGADGRMKKRVHYAKFTGDVILYASENDPDCADGIYEDGNYPFVVRSLFPKGESLEGIGYVAIGADTQKRIDLMMRYMMENMEDSANERYFSKKDGGISVAQFLDKRRKVVEVEGNISEERLQRIDGRTLDGLYMTLFDRAVNEQKENSSNRDVSQGSATGGVTSGSGLAILQEAGNKSSRYELTILFEAEEEISAMIVNRIRQFWTSPQIFRITEPNGGLGFVEFDPASIQQQVTGTVTVNGVDEQTVRVPEFDFKIVAQKKAGYSQTAQNETAVNLWNMGVFNPEMAQQALGLLDVMSFDGSEKIRQYVENGQTLQNTVEMLRQQIFQMTGQDPLAGTGAPMGMPQGNPGADPVAAANEGAMAAQTSYTKRLLEASSIAGGGADLSPQ